MGSACHIPPDLEIGARVETARNLWHLPEPIWSKIWNKAAGRGVTVAVLDTGYRSHPDLPKPVAEKSFIRGEAVEDVSSGHGTHCAGTVLGRNGIGVAPGAELIVGKVLSNRGSGSTQGIADGVKWAVDNGADVVSMSLGGGGFDRYFQQALEYAEEKGCIVNSAAGNAGYNGANSIDYPGKYQESLCTGAYQKTGAIANFSSGGREIDWACPGQDIVSASHRGGYISMSGTSMATPFGRR